MSTVKINATFNPEFTWNPDMSVAPAGVKMYVETTKGKVFLATFDAGYRNGVGAWFSDSGTLLTGVVRWQMNTTAYSEHLKKRQNAGAAISSSLVDSPYFSKHLKAIYDDGSADVSLEELVGA